MPNYCRNILTISCSDQELLTKIKELILTYDDGSSFTMDKLLPRPAKYGTFSGFPNFAYSWGIHVWGTYWDAIEPIINEGDEFVSLDYDTACRPNIQWVETLCLIIDHMFFNEDENWTLTLEHNYWEYGREYGGRLLWSPGSEINYNEYHIVEYAYRHMKGLHRYLISRGHEAFNPDLKRHDDLLEKYST